MSQDSSSSGKTAAVVIGMVVVIIAALGAFYWFIYLPQQEAEEQARLEQIKQEEAEKKRQEELAAKKAQYEDLIQKADAAYEQEDWQSAQSLYSQASSLLPDQQYAKDRLATVNAKLQEIADQEARRQAGVIEQISTPTGRHHIIASSSIDDDLAMDYAKKLAQDGYNVKIIEHDAAKNLYYRVSVGDFGTREEAESQIPSFSSLEGELWVLKF